MKLLSHCMEGQREASLIYSLMYRRVGWQISDLVTYVICPHLTLLLSMLFFLVYEMQLEKDFSHLMCW